MAHRYFCFLMSNSDHRVTNTEETHIVLANFCHAFIQYVCIGPLLLPGTGVGSPWLPRPPSTDETIGIFGKRRKHLHLNGLNSKPDA